MSGGAVNLQAQVESVLGELVRVATVELTKLFESRYRASAAGQTLHTLCNFSSEDSKRSIGVQVNQDINPLLTLSESSFLPDGDCLGDLEEEVLQSCFPPSEILLVPNDPADPDWFPLKEEPVGLTGDLVQFSILEAEYLSGADNQTKVILHVSTGPAADPSVCASTESPPAVQQPLVIQPKTAESTYEEKVQFVHPVRVKQEPPVPESVTSKNPVQAGPQQAVVGTASGDAYSPSPADGAVTSTQPRGKKALSPKKENNSVPITPAAVPTTPTSVQITPTAVPTTPTAVQITPTAVPTTPTAVPTTPTAVPTTPTAVPITPGGSVDPKLLLPCKVKLLDIVSVPDSELNDEGDPANTANQNKALHLSKDLHHHHPGFHTGRRLCCFTRCEDSIWRLKKGLAHSRDGYPCGICGKVFKRRKVVRRHERFHTGEKPYSCTVCSKAFALRKSLRRHVRFHTGEKPHTCSHCGKKFRLRDNLKAHLRFHSGEKPFSCTTCGKTFRILRNFERHRLSQCEAFVPSFRTLAGF